MNKYYLKELKDAWKKHNSLFFYYLMLRVKSQITFSAEEVSDFINFMIKETTDDKFNDKSKAFWHVIFEFELHRKLPKKGPPFIGLLIEEGSLTVLLLLFEYPLKPNLRHNGPNADTPLHYLCKQRWLGKDELYEKCMNWLLTNEEVDVHAFNCDFKTPLDLAQEMGNEKAVAMLSKLGFIANDKREEMKLVISNCRMEKPLGNYDLANMAFSQVHSWLKILQPADHKIVEGLTLDVLTNTSYWRRREATESKQQIIILQEACRQDYRHLVFFFVDLAGMDPCLIDEWNDNLSAVDVAEDVHAIHILPRLWEKDRREKLPKLDDRIWSLRGVDGNNILHNAFSPRYSPKGTYRILQFSGLRLMGVKNDWKMMPTVPDEVLETGVLTKFLDSKVMKHGERKPTMMTVKGDRMLEKFSTWHRAREISLDLQLLIEIDSDGNPDFGMENLHEMSKRKIYHQYLVHPIIKILLLYRWERLRWIFFLNLFFCALLTVCLTVNIVWTSTMKSDIFTGTRYLQGILIILLLLRETVQGCIQRKEYFLPTQYENYFEILIIALGGFLTFTDHNNSTYQHIGAFTILLSWLQLMLLIGKLPKFSVQIEMFLLVLTTFVKFLFVYSLMIFAFAMAFIVLFHPNSEDTDVKFSGFFETVFQTFVMIGGEFNASDIPFGNYPVTSHLIFLLFVFTVAIVLLNLLNGLAVYDTQTIKQDASSFTFLSRLQYLALLDKFSKFLPKTPWLPSCFGCFSSELSYVLSDEDIWRELEQIIFEQQRDGLDLPRYEKMQCEDLSKQMNKLLEKKQVQDSEAMEKLSEKLLKQFEELNQKMNRLEGMINSGPVQYNIRLS